ncbi:hypothetical protein ACFFHC_00050 [Kytococcus schroeteri]|uniref:hypothetical protein n=1 Tax=Kytococcus schroeteri TaxID=138300 RepID=UPI0035E68005
MLPLLGVSALRTTVFMGQLAYAAVWYHDRFGLDSVAFAQAVLFLAGAAWVAVACTALVALGHSVVAAGLALGGWRGVAVVLAVTMLACLPCLARPRGTLRG